MVKAASPSDMLARAGSIPELIRLRAYHTPDAAGLKERSTSGWQESTWKTLDHLVAQAAEQLRGYGCKPGDAIAIMAATSVFWDISQYAIMINGAVIVGIDAHDTADNIHTIITSAKISGVITDNPEQLTKLDPVCRNKLNFILTALPTSSPGEVNYQALYQSPAAPPAVTGQPEIAANDRATIIFTSGTTGRPKGIPFTHKQILIACQSAITAYNDVTDAARLVCWLPLSNLFQRMMNYCAIAVGAQTYYVAHPQEVLDNLPEIKPAVFIAVPRFYEKLYEGIHKKIQQAPPPARRIFTLAHHLRGKALQKPANNLLAQVIIRTTDRIVFNKFRRQLFGDDLKYAISGSAPMPLWLLEWYRTCGILILEAYGISENIVPVACNTPQHYKFGTVGKALPPNRVRLAVDKEVEVSGPGVFSHYLTFGSDQKQLTKDGYLKTGDEGEIDAQGFIRLTGRKTDFFKSSTGRRIVPGPIEKLLNSCPHLDHTIVVGAGRKVPIACATLTRQAWETADELFLEQLRQEIIQQLSTEIADWQKPAAILLLLEEFSINGGEITANLKLRKNFVAEKYCREIEHSYALLEDSTRQNICRHLNSKAITIIL